MKVIPITEYEAPRFKPVRVELVIESAEELGLLLDGFNHNMNMANSAIKARDYRLQPPYLSPEARKLANLFSAILTGIRASSELAAVAAR
jgi:hypothetical protein